MNQKKSSSTGNAREKQKVNKSEVIIYLIDMEMINVCNISTFVVLRNEIKSIGLV